MKTSGLVLDVNETLFSIAPVEARFAEVGLDRNLVPLWFARVLRDGFALAATETAEAFPVIAAHHVRVLLEERGREASEETVAHVLGGFEEVAAHPDVAEGLRSAREAGLVVATLTNGTRTITADFLRRAGLGDLVDATLEARSSGVWKPHPRAYTWAAEQLGLQPGELVLVAVHPWDVHGAVTAGLGGAWLDRDGGRYPGHFRSPDLRGPSLGRVVEVIVGTRAVDEFE